MLIYSHHFWVEYGDQIPGCSTRYAVTNHHKGRKLVYQSDSKAACIQQAQRLNNFLPANGSEEIYAQQCKAAMKDHREVEGE